VRTTPGRRGPGNLIKEVILLAVPNRTAFLTSDPREIPTLLKIAPPIFRIYLIGEHNYKHPKVTVMDSKKLIFTFKGKQRHAILESFIANDMIRRGLTDINSGKREELFIKTISDSINRCVYIGIDQYPHVVENYIQNLNQAEYFADFLENQFQNKPCILVGSGPSIQKNIHVLKSLTDKALIIACGSGLRKLVENDIIPHFLTILDPYPIMHTVIKPYLSQIKNKTILVSALMGNMQIGKDFEGVKIFCITGDSDFSIDSNVSFGVSSSVTSLALGLANFMGCNPIIFVGQDMTSPDYDGIADYLRVFINFSKTQKQYISFINATEGGEGIVGASHITLQNAANKYLKNDFQFKLPALPPPVKKNYNIESIKIKYQQQYNEWLEYSKLLEE
jgi:hypothetical protein